MAIILEGPDNSGKTTLCKDLQKLNADFQSFHPGGRPKDEEIGGLLVSQLKLAVERPDLIIDRVTAISEQVYRPGMLGDVQYSEWCKTITKYSATVIVYCKPPIDTLLQRESISFREEEDEETRNRILDNLHLYVQNYESVMAKLPHVTYDYTNETEAAWLRKYMSDALRTGDYTKLRDIARVIA
jgi:hypothetical protein